MTNPTSALDLDPTNPEHQVIGLKYMVTLLVTYPGQTEFTEEQVKAVSDRGVSARAVKGTNANGERVLRFEIPTEEELDRQAEEFVRSLLRQAGIPEDAIEEAIEQAKDEIAAEDAALSV